MMKRILSLIVIFLLCLALPLDADARKKKKKPKKNQRHLELNEEGVQAMIEGEYEKAIQLLEESLGMMEVNITYLNLGRAYSKVGRCVEALDKYDRMAVAPRVESPPPEELYKILVRYRKELIEECPGQVIFRCSPESIQVVVDDDAPIACPTSPVDLAAGDHHFEGLLDGAAVAQQDSTIKGMSTIYVDIKAPPPPPPIQPVADDSLNPLDAVAWASLGTGVGILAVAFVIDAAVIVPQIDQFKRLELQNPGEASRMLEDIETNQGISLGLMIGGGTLVAAGTGLILYRLLSSDSEEPATTTAGLALDSQGAHLSLTTRF